MPSPSPISHPALLSLRDDDVIFFLNPRRQRERATRMAGNLWEALLAEQVGSSERAGDASVLVSERMNE